MSSLVLLAAGDSARMGTPKQLLVFRGRSLLRRAAEEALASGCWALCELLCELSLDRTRAPPLLHRAARPGSSGRQRLSDASGEGGVPEMRGRSRAAAPLLTPPSTCDAPWKAAERHLLRAPRRNGPTSPRPPTARSRFVRLGCDRHLVHSPRVPPTSGGSRLWPRRPLVLRLRAHQVPAQAYHDGRSYGAAPPVRFGDRSVSPARDGR